MPSTITRQKIVDAVKTRMATILTTGGYYTNLGQKVAEWRVSPLADTELPALSVSDPSDEPLAASLGGSNSIIDRTLTVVISLPFAGGSAAAGEAIRKALADVYKAIGTSTGGYPGETWSNLAYATDDLGNKLIVDQEDRRLLGIDVTIAISYRTQKWQESL